MSGGRVADVCARTRTQAKDTRRRCHLVHLALHRLTASDAPLASAWCQQGELGVALASSKELIPLALPAVSLGREATPSTPRRMLYSEARPPQNKPRVPPALCSAHSQSVVAHSIATVRALLKEEPVSHGRRERGWITPPKRLSQADSNSAPTVAPSTSGGGMALLMRMQHQYDVVRPLALGPFSRSPCAPSEPRPAGSRPKVGIRRTRVSFGL